MTTSTSTAASLRGTGFGRLWTSAGCSNLADGIVLVGLPVLATTVTTSPALVSGVTVAVMLPSVLTALPSGAVADRSDRRRVMVLANLARALGLTGVLAMVVVGELTLAAIYLAAIVAGTVEHFADTTAQATVPSLVGPDRLEGANARMIGTQTVANNAVGAPIGAVLATVGAAALLGPSILLYLAAAVVVSRLRLPPPARRAGASEPARMRDDVLEGLRHLWNDDVLRPIAIAGGFANLGNLAFFSVAVLYVLGPLGLPEVAYGWMAAVVAGGGLLGSVMAPRIISRFGRARALHAAFVVNTAVFAVLALVPQPVVAYLAVGVLGTAGLVTNVASRSVRQLLTPDHLLGRVTASTLTLALIATPLGALLGGLVSEVAGVLAAAVLATAANGVGLLLILRVTPARIDARLAA